MPGIIFKSPVVSAGHGREQDMKNTIVIGATSGIGRALAVEFSRRGHAVGVTGRRKEMLESLKSEIGGGVFAAQMDVLRTGEAVDTLKRLIEEMGDVGTIVINSGVLFRSAGWEGIKKMIDTNVTGFVAMAEESMGYFCRRGNGRLVGISSIAGIRGAKGTPTYNASKAFVSTYLDGLRHRAAYDKLDIQVTDIRPGFVRTAMIEGRANQFWVASPEKAARQIADAVQKKKKCVYITRRWRLIAGLARIVPDKVYHRV